MNRRNLPASSRQPVSSPPAAMNLPIPYSHPLAPRRDGEDFLVSPTSALHTVLRWWLIVLPLSCLLALFSAGLVWYLFEPQYRAAAWIQIQDESPYLVTQEADEPPQKSEQFVETQIELLSGPLVLEPVAADPEIGSLPELQRAENAAETLAENVRVVQVGRSEMFQVAFTGPDPQHAARIVNAIVDEYFRLRDGQQVEQAGRMIQLLEEEKERRAEIVRDLRDQMRQLSQEVFGQPLLDKPPGESLFTHPLQALEERITSTEVDRRMLEIEAQALKEAMDQGAIQVPEYMIELAVDESTEIQDLRGVIAEKRTMLQRTASVSRLGKDATAYQRLAREIADHEVALEESLARMRPRVRQKMESMSDLDRKRQLSELQARVDMQRSIEDMLRSRHQTQMRELGQAAGSSLELEFLRAELAREEHIFELIGDRVTTLRTETRAPGRVSRIRPATPPEDPVQKIPLKHLTLAVVFSICLPWGGIFVWDYHVRPISDAEQIQKGSLLMVLAEVARLPMQTRRQRVGPRAAGRSMSLYEESIDSLRTCLTLGEPSKSMKCFALASAVSGEGKTSIAAQLAVSLARSSSGTVLLIDADLRSPDIHRLFHVRLTPGLAQLLDGGCSLEEAIVTNWSEHLHILPAGELHKNPHKLFAGRVFGETLDQLRRQYDCVVIDTAPLLAASESLVIAQEADGVVLCTMRDRSREDQVRRAHQRLMASGASTIGAVLNGVPVKRYARTYGSYPHA